MQDPTAPATNKNTMGLVGFILSIVGLILCGLTAPFGLIVSLIALRKKPRSFAIAGTLIGLLGLCGWGALYAIWGALVTGGTGLLVMLGPDFETRFDMGVLQGLTQAYADENGSLPNNLSDIDGVPEGFRTDPWDNEYVLEPSIDGQSFTIISAGPDGELGNADDIRFP